MSPQKLWNRRFARLEAARRQTQDGEMLIVGMLCKLALIRFDAMQCFNAGVHSHEAKSKYEALMEKASQLRKRIAFQRRHIRELERERHRIARRLGFLQPA